MKSSIFVSFVCWFLVACGGGGTVKPSVVTIPDITAYLAVSRCPDGQPAVLSNCANSMPQKASDPMLVRKLDWSGHTGNQIEDTYLSNNGQYYVNTFSYAPNRQFVPGNGDGGDVLVTDGTTVRITFTQNGTSGGGTIAGYWVGANCGGTGWLLFDNTAPTGRWADKVALLKGSVDPNACPNLSSAYTRWRLENANVPFVVNGQVQQINLPVVISEHFGGASIGNAHSMERVVMAKGFARVLWEAWATTPPLGIQNWSCPGIAPWSDPPAPGWYLQDRRCPTQISVGDGSMTGDIYGWPPF